jgi:hypothetical protein
MSDQRFHEDLRYVLLEDAPGEVPDDLRRRVAAVPATDPVVSRPSGPAWRHSAPVWIAAVAAVVVVLVVASWWFGPASRPGVGGEPSSSPSVQPTTSPSSPALSSPSPAPTSTPAPATAVGACRATDVEGRILGWQGAAGSRIADVEIANKTARSCLLRGTPGLQMVDAADRVLIDSATAGASGQPHATSTDATFELTPGGHLRTEVQSSNYCGPVPSLPIGIAFALPSDGGRFVAMPGPAVSSADAAPPCLGSTGSQIAMNGWRRTP